MRIKPFQPCCRKSAIQAFQQGIFYLIGCQNCSTCFSITDDPELFPHQVIIYNKINPDYPHPFDLIFSKDKIIFMLP